MFQRKLQKGEETMIGSLFEVVQEANTGSHGRRAPPPPHPFPFRWALFLPLALLCFSPIRLIIAELEGEMPGDENYAPPLTRVECVASCHFGFFVCCPLARQRSMIIPCSSSAIESFQIDMQRPPGAILAQL